MKLHRFIKDLDLDQDTLTITDGDFFNQIKNVLRLSQGDQIILCDGKGHEAVAQITQIEKKEITVQVMERKQNTNEPVRGVSLYCAMLKRENFELVVQKATEIGVSAIIPLITARTVKTGFKKERIEKIVREAAEQSGRGVVPQVFDPVSFDEMEKPEGVSIFCDPSGDDFSKIKLENEKHVNIFIGPEGGWSDEEVVFAKDHGFTIISFGSLVFRAETAAIIASYEAIYGM